MVNNIKHILTTPQEMQEEPPLNFPPEHSKDFRRLSELNPAVVDLGDGRLELFPRVIYRNNYGTFSMITRRKGTLEGKIIRLDPKKEEEVVFTAREPHARQGYEDLRLSSMETEQVYHAFPVVYDGLVARTEYRRTYEHDPKNRNHFEDFGIIFPNIEIGDALSRVRNKHCRKYWEREHGVQRLIELRKRDPSRESEILLGTKDASAYPLKVDGKYGVILRLKPNIQIVYIECWEDLARREFWQNIVSNIEDHTLLEAPNPDENWIGLGGVPFELPGHGMIIPYHTGTMKPTRIYTGDYALVDKRDPKKVLGKTNGALKVTESWERVGEMQDVPGDIVFPTGNVIHNDFIYTIYGYGDYGIAYTSMESNDLLKRLN